MSYLDTTSEPAADLETGRRWLPALLLLFIGSGCAALIYEVVWFQLLQLSVGSSAVSLGILLGIFMGGMCLGSFLLPRFISARHHPLRVYAVSGARHRGVRPDRSVRRSADRRVLHDHRRHGTGEPLSSGDCRWHLPAAADDADGGDASRHRPMGEGDAHRVSHGSAISTAATSPAPSSGASWLVFTFCACTTCRLPLTWPWQLNVLVALLGFAIARVTPYTPADDNKEVAAPPPESRLIYVAIALSGLTALGAEVVWTRVLSLLFGATTYTFSLILAVFLVGLGHRQHYRRGSCAAPAQASHCARLVPAPAVRDDRVGCLRDRRVASVLADQSVDLDQSVIQLSARSDACDLGAAALDAAVGRKLSAGARRGGARHLGPGPARRAAFTPPTRSARSSARSSAASCCWAPSAVR